MRMVAAVRMILTRMTVILTQSIFFHVIPHTLIYHKRKRQTNVRNCFELISEHME